MATVLCIDDDPRVLEIQKALLEASGYRVLTAPDGAIGIAISRKRSVDVVVLDFNNFNMTGMDGYQTAAVLLKWQPTLPVVICSGSADLPESLKWFADALVQKSDGPGALLAAIEKVICSVQQPKRSPSPDVGTEEPLSS